VHEHPGHAGAGVPWVLMHRRGDSRDMDARAGYADVVAEVRQALCRRVDAALAAGVAVDRLVVDPGLGFAKRPEHDLALLAHLDGITALGLPVLVGASRKRFLGAVLAADDGRTRTPAERDDATLATTVLAAGAGAWGVRVHSVAGSADAVRMVAAVATARCGAPGRGATRTQDLAHERRTGEPRAPRTATDDTERWRSA
jgi:dihydropteroate synthase